MQYRKLGRTGMEVSEVGFGAWGIGKHMWIGAEDEASLQALKIARDEGINLFDTALAYGEGHSEQLISRAFGKSPEVIIATKVPPKNRIWPATASTPLDAAFPREYVLSCLETSLKNLGREQIDVYQFHVWTDAWAGNEEWLRTVEQMRSSGKVRAVGISVGEDDSSDVLEALKTGVIDTVQVIYNIFEQSPEDKLFPYCRENKIGILARVPFDEGSLTGKIRPDTTFPAGDWRASYFGGDRKQQVWDRVQGISRDTNTPIDQLPELALRFCLSDPTVSTVIPGMRTANHVRSNAAASDAGTLSNQTMAVLRNYRWVRNFYNPA